MSQRISINYSIKIEELSGEIDRLYGNLLGDLEQAKAKHSVPEDLLSVTAIEELSRLKDCLDDLRFRAVDIENLIVSYLKYASTEVTERTSDKMELMYKKLSDAARHLNIENGQKDEVSD